MQQLRENVFRKLLNISENSILGILTSLVFSPTLQLHSRLEKYQPKLWCSLASTRESKTELEAFQASFPKNCHYLTWLLILCKTHFQGCLFNLTASSPSTKLFTEGICQKQRQVSVLSLRLPEMMDDTWGQIRD